MKSLSPLCLFPLCLFPLCLLMCCLGSAQAQGRPVRVFAVVVGNNAPHVPSAARLTYADDDAIRMLRLFEVLPGRVTLLTRMDGATRASDGELASRARPPTVAELRTAVNEMVPYIIGARAAGWETAFYVFFAGHGDRKQFAAAGAELSYLYLDRPMSSWDLYELVDAVPADTRHVLIDACHSLDVVTGRGKRYADEPDVDLGHVVGDFLDAHSLRARPGIGVVVSATPENTALESRTLRSGIYTHVVRSGLLGGADLNGDLVVTYGELEAFTRIATAPTDETPRSIWFYAEPPRGDRDATLVDLRRASAPALHVPAAQQTRFAVHTADGSSYAGFYGAPNVDTRLLLVGGGDFVLIRWDRRARHVQGELALHTGGLALRSVLKLTAPRWLAPGTADVSDVDRGAAHALFREPFGHTLKHRVLEPIQPMRRSSSPHRRLLVLGLDVAGPVSPSAARALQLVVEEVVTESVSPTRIDVLSEAEAPPGLNVIGLRQAAQRCLAGACDAFSGVDAVIHGRLSALGETDLQIELATVEAGGRVRARVADRLPADSAGAAASLAPALGSLVAFLPPAPPAPAVVAAPGEITPWIEISIGEPERMTGVPTLGFTGLALGIALAIGGGLAHMEAIDAREAHQRQQDCFDCRADARDRFDTYSGLSKSLFVGAAVLSLGGTALTAWHYLDAQPVMPVVGTYGGAPVLGCGGRF